MSSTGVVPAQSTIRSRAKDGLFTELVPLQAFADPVLGPWLKNMARKANLQDATTNLSAEGWIENVGTGKKLDTTKVQYAFCKRAMSDGRDAEQPVENIVVIAMVNGALVGVR